MCVFWAAAELPQMPKQKKLAHASYSALGKGRCMKSLKTLLGFLPGSMRPIAAHAASEAPASDFLK